MSGSPGEFFLTREQFQRAMRNGQGRVIQYLKTSPADPYLDIIEYAVTHALGYDPQCEGGREEWVLEIVELVGGLPHFREAILRALRTATEYYSVSQLAGLARHLALRGDGEARTTMYDSFAQRVAQYDHGEEVAGALDIVDMDGRDGLRYVAQIYGRRCLNDSGYEPHDFRWFETDVFAENAIDAALKEMSQHDDAVRVYFERLRKEDVESVIRSSETPRKHELARMSFAEFMATPRGPFELRRWADVASDSGILEAAEFVCASRDHEHIDRVLTVFAIRPWPLNATILLDWLNEEHAEPHRPVRITSALQLLSSPEVRLAGLTYLNNPTTVVRGIQLLCGSAQREDTDAIIAACGRIDPDGDADEIHHVGHALLDFFDEDRAADGIEALHWIYEHSPCSLCRLHAIERLDESGVMPEWMEEEAQYDSYERTRKYVLGENDDDQDDG